MRSGSARWVVAVAAVLVVSVVGWVLSTRMPEQMQPPAASGPCRSSMTLRVVTAAAFEPVLTQLAPTLERAPECLRLETTTFDGQPALDHVRAAAPDVWIADDGAWAMDTGPDLLVPRGRAGSGDVLATSPIYQVTDTATAERITDAGGSWLALANLLSRGSGLRLTAPPPAGSGAGLVGFGAFAEAVWLDRGVHIATAVSVAARRASRPHRGPGPALPTRPGEIGLVPEYALLPVLGSAAENLAILTGSDRTAMLRFTWFPGAAAVDDPGRRVALDQLRAALTSTDADTMVDKAGLRRPRPPLSTAVGSHETNVSPARTTAPSLTCKRKPSPRSCTVSMPR